MASDVAFYTERLAHKEHELNELQAAFNKYKLKAKVKFDQLRKEVNAYCTNGGHSLNEKENNALLLIRLAENETAMEAVCREAEVLRKEVARKQTQLNDQLILIKNMEEQIRSSQPLSSVEIQERKRAAQMIDMDRIHQQMLFKDERIVELNNVILDKERQILDLQELCREQGEVASVTSQAARIVQKQWEDKNRERREVGTETDAVLWSPARVGHRQETRPRADSPGRAIATRGTANTSPPPLDPSEALERTTSRRGGDDDDDSPGTSNSLLGKSPDLDSSLRKKNRKRVTFDLISTVPPQQAQRAPPGEQFTHVIVELSEENERLRRELHEATENLSQVQRRLNEVETDMTKVVRDGKTQALKARAVAQARIKELEDHMAELNAQHADQVDRLQTEVESLRSTREWEVEQNAQLREQLNQAKVLMGSYLINGKSARRNYLFRSGKRELSNAIVRWPIVDLISTLESVVPMSKKRRTKNHKLTEELDASEKANREWEVKVSHGEEFLDQLIEDLAEAEDIINYMERQKHSILDDVDKLKDAIIAQDQLIEILEADIVIYEEHIGILRESLGASKVDHRSLLRSKAFETKLKALEKEKEQIDRRSNEDRLLTKALDQKCKVLEEENEKLMEKLCELEMREREEAEMAETCRQLEQKIAEAEEKAALEKAECDLRVEAARLDAERKSNEAVRLLDELRDARDELSKRRSSSMDGRTEQRRSFDPDQTQLNADVEQLRSRVAEQDAELVRLRVDAAQVDSLREELQQLNTKCAETAEQLDAMRCNNFDLMTKAEVLTADLESAGEREQKWREMYEKAASELEVKEQNEQKEAAVSEELQRVKSDLEQERARVEDLEKELTVVRRQLTETEASLAGERISLIESNERIKRLEEELLSTRCELDNARLGLLETTAVKKELEQLREELEVERSSGRAKWEEVCRKVLEQESSSSQSRKNSLEVINKVQHLEYITAFEEKITNLEKELQEAKAKNEQDKAEKKKLKAALKQLRDREKNRSEPRSEVQPVAEEQQHLQQHLEQHQQQHQHQLQQQHQQQQEQPNVVNVQQEEHQQSSATSEPASASQVEQLKMSIKELELENRLSRELNTEYSHTMLEMEKEVIALKAQVTSLRGESEHFEMELKLHEMLEEELEKELSDARQKNKELTEAMQNSEESLEQFNERAGSDAVKNEQLTNELMSEVHQLREQKLMLEEQLRAATAKVVADESAMAQERENFAEIDKAHCEEVRELSISLADARRTISDTEVRLSEAEANFAESQSRVFELNRALDEKSTEIERLQQELVRLQEVDSQVQQTTLVRAANSTSEVVASVLVGELESVRWEGSPRTESVEPTTAAEHSDSPTTAQSSSVVTAPGAQESGVPSGSDLFAENLILRQCVNESTQMQNDLSQDVEKMWQLKTELENAVEALKGEIWSLNGQLKASILDREQLQDRVVELDSSLAAEKKRADALDCELSEQTELTEKASRQAAEAENESNRRLAECLEMETRREQVEKAYAQLSEYYSQLQAAYNVIYAQLKQFEAEKNVVASEQQTSSTAPQSEDNVLHVVDTMISELHLEVDASVDLHGKVLLIQKALREKLAELEQHQQAIAEHRRTNDALNEQLRALEDETSKAGGETLDAKARLLQLEGELEWKQDECDSLRRRVDELQNAIDQLIERNGETDAAKLATRQADVDALFRANAELAHTNVRLQNELEESEERVVSSAGGDESQRIEELQAELLETKSSEESLRRQLAEVRAILTETEQKLDQITVSERDRVATEPQCELSEKAETLSLTEAQSSTQSASLEEAVKESVDLHDEVERLRSVEKLLNERIMSLEDQLLEVEERLQETEDELISEKKNVEALEAEKQSMREQVEANDQNGSSNEAVLKQQLDQATEQLESLRMELKQLQEQQLEKNDQDGWGVESTGEDELTPVKEELEHVSKQLEEQKRIAAQLKITADETLDKERADHIVQMQRIHDELAAVRTELEKTKELLKEKELLLGAAEKPEEEWGWDEPQGNASGGELSALQANLRSMESAHRQLKETIDRHQQKIADLEEELNNAVASRDECKEELTDACEQVNDLQRQLREMRRQAEVHKEIEERLNGRISELESKAENSWGDEWGSSNGKTDDDRQEQERLSAEAYERIGELELEVEQKVSALVDAEKELAALRERLEKVENEKQQSVVQKTSDENGWSEPDKDTEDEVKMERQRREEAEALADNLRRVAATLREQIDNLQEKLLVEEEEKKRKLVETEELTTEVLRLRTAVESRTEIQEAEHQRSECELETLCEERQRIQDDLTSAENEKIRLEEQLMASKSSCDEMKTELQLLSDTNSELTQEIEKIRKRLEDAEASFVTVEAENFSLTDRLANAEKELEKVRSDLRAKLEQENQNEESVAANRSKWEQLEKILSDVRKELEEKELQNSLLKDSEAKLLDSVDEFGLQAEKYQLEAERLQKVVNTLERERMVLEEEMEQMRRSKVEKDDQQLLQSTSATPSSSYDNRELSLVTSQLETLTAERNELRNRLENTESRLRVSLQEKQTISRSYEQLRAKLAARRQALNASRDSSRRSSVTISEVDVTEDSRDTRRLEEPAVRSSSGTFVSHQAVEKDVIRRRSGHH
ncbi:hypothetical protein Q1695_011145 [Nippostrongylus brasiliensis]|nr:hypothetical protein Q1695_011145 [Nippostrongylus brasiliensis]